MLDATRGEMTWRNGDHEVRLTFDVATRDFRLAASSPQGVRLWTRDGTLRGAGIGRGGTAFAE